MDASRQRYRLQRIVLTLQRHDGRAIVAAAAKAQQAADFLHGFSEDADDNSPVG
jgi:antirestriction protein ArdC